MRILVSCAECKRRYNASRSKIGSRFRCRCGTVLTVTPPQGHESRVVRCAACGAARTEGSRACSHCSSDFSLHERDLHTVCPDCLTRVSDRAKFCHHCGSPLSSDETAGEPTSRICPACADESKLHSRTLGNSNASSLECDGCAGLWLSNEAFEQLARRAEESLAVAVGRAEKRSQPQIVIPPQRKGYRPCPVCQKLMSRTNYGLRQTGRASGTVVDACRDHGIWFDASELARVLDWLRDDAGDVSDVAAAPDGVRSPGGAAAGPAVTRHVSSTTHSDGTSITRTTVIRSSSIVAGSALEGSLSLVLNSMFGLNLE